MRLGHDGIGWLVCTKSRHAKEFWEDTTRAKKATKSKAATILSIVLGRY